ncbi:DUF2786 domain-containing protein [Enterococcus sp. BWR-S5]|uniref:DUF2786 domain-containing protein n=1 Tax=Enterococcus sp. BWR-S5 TaxID=2787714 RepID=UPI0019220BB7|nr:DUF2786 domain-containing protein [Enterococcus sp. BWR-S5]MBL1227248.1 hypothetical protein [Enterococcus sp. BWR-S5]
MTNRKKYDEIVKKIRGLLAISKDKHDDGECQSAFLLAQKLRMKYDISKEDIHDPELDKEPINQESITVSKKLFWWEKSLALIIAENFRLKVFVSGEVLPGNQRRTKQLKFIGNQSDLELGKELYILAYEALIFYSKKFVDSYYEENHLKRNRYFTESLKSSYITGFLNGLESRFEEQRAQLTEEYGLMVIIPKEVEEAYDDFFNNFDGETGSNTYNEPNPEISEAYYKGVSEGESIDFTKSSISTDYSSLVGNFIKFNEGVTRGLVAKIIDVKEKYFHLLIMNYTSEGSSLETPAFYDWSLHVEHDFEAASEKEIEWFKAYEKKDLDFFKKNIHESYRESRLNMFETNIQEALRALSRY